MGRMKNVTLTGAIDGSNTVFSANQPLSAYDWVHYDGGMHRPTDSDAPSVDLSTGTFTFAVAPVDNGAVNYQPFAQVYDTSPDYAVAPTPALSTGDGSRLVIVRGQYWVRSFLLTDDTGTPVDLTLRKTFLSIKDRPDDTTTAFVAITSADSMAIAFDQSSTGGTRGLVTAAISPIGTLLLPTKRSLLIEVWSAVTSDLSDPQRHYIGVADCLPRTAVVA